MSKIDQGILLAVSAEEIRNGSYEIPDTVKRIGNEVFAKNTTLKRMTIPKGVIVINFGAFGACRNMSDLTFTEGLERIMQQAFSGCESLTRLSLPKSLESIGSLTFHNCKKLRRIDFYAKIKKIDVTAFEGCDSIEIITINADNEQKYQAAKKLLPQHLQSKAVWEKEYIRETQKKAFQELLQTDPELNEPYKVCYASEITEEEIHIRLYLDIAFFKEGGIAKEKMHYYGRAQIRINKIPVPDITNAEAMSKYNSKCLNMALYYAKMGTPQEETLSVSNVRAGMYGRSTAASTESETSCSETHHHPA